MFTRNQHCGLVIFWGDGGHNRDIDIMPASLGNDCRILLLG